jgi:hypothetical protein
MDAATIDGQLEFIAYELCNGFQAVGLALKRAKTVEEAREVVEPYVRRLSVTEMKGEEGRPSIASTLGGIGEMR